MFSRRGSYEAPQAAEATYANLNIDSLKLQRKPASEQLAAQGFSGRARRLGWYLGAAAADLFGNQFRSCLTVKQSP